jgi:CRP/FNR family transcriptional regulator
MPPQVTASLLERAVEVALEPGEIFYRRTHHAETALCAVVIDGLLRFYISAQDGRAMTVRYAGRGELIGVLGMAIGAASSSTLGGTSFDGEALQPSRILTLPKPAVVAAARNNAALSWALVREVAIQTMHVQEMIAANVFSPIRQRVARHLINLAARQGPDLVVSASHQEIADAIGSVREVVSRALCRFRAEGLVERRGRRLIVPNAARLHAASIAYRG